MKILILIFYSLFFIFISCSSVPVKPLLEQQRIPIRIQPFQDLTGQYKFLTPSFDSLMLIVSSPALIEVIEPDEYIKGYSYQRTYQNPIRLLGLGDKEKAKFQLTGEVELISYGPLKDIDSRIATYSLFGLFGLALSNNTDLAAYVQYRIFLNDSNGNTIDNFLVIGISSGDRTKKSRKQLMMEANLIAACNFKFQFIQSLSKQNISADFQTIKRFSDAQAVEYSLESMKNLMRTRDSK